MTVWLAPFFIACVETSQQLRTHHVKWILRQVVCWNINWTKISAVITYLLPWLKALNDWWIACYSTLPPLYVTKDLLPEWTGWYRSSTGLKGSFPISAHDYSFTAIRLHHDYVSKDNARTLIKGLRNTSELQWLLHHDRNMIFFFFAF